jgi:GntR family transcriptional regulator/MocR family aminotransferase
VVHASESVSDQTSSRELLVDLTGVGRGRLAAELERSLREAIRSGRLRPGVRLPSTRSLAVDLGVSRSVVVEAYDQLAAEGYLATRPGAAARVSDLSAAGPGGGAGGGSAPVPRSSGGRPAPPTRPAPTPVGAADPALSPARPGEVDLRPGSPDLAGLPRATYARAVRRALATLTDAELGYGDPRGLPRLREALADYLGRVRGAVVDPGDLVVVNGFAQGLVVVSRLLAGLGVGAAVVEDPGSFHTSGHLAAQGVAPAPVPVDAEGLDVGAIGPGLRAALVTPAHQFPTGAVLSPDRRRRLVEWAERVDGLVVEDDYDAEYRYDHHPVGAVQGMAPGRVVLGGSTSKTLAPGLRLGWLAVPPALSADAAGHKRHIDIMAPVLEQAALAELLASGAYERHIRRSRARYRGLRDVVVEVLAAELPGAVVRGTSAGLHLLVETPGVGDEAAAVAEAARRGVRVVGIGPHRHRAGPAGFVLGYGHLPEPALRRALATLAAVVRGAAG